MEEVGAEVRRDGLKNGRKEEGRGEAVHEEEVELGVGVAGAGGGGIDDLCAERRESVRAPTRSRSGLTVAIHMSSSHFSTHSSQLGLLPKPSLPSLRALALSLSPSSSHSLAPSSPSNFHSSHHLTILSPSLSSTLSSLGKSSIRPARPAARLGSCRMRSRTVNPPKPARGILGPSRSSLLAVRAKLSLEGDATGKPERKGTELATRLPALPPNLSEEKALLMVEWSWEGRGGMGGQAAGKREVRRAEVTADCASPSATRASSANSMP